MKWPFYCMIASPQPLPQEGGANIRKRNNSPFSPGRRGLGG